MWWRTAVLQRSSIFGQNLLGLSPILLFVVIAEELCPVYPYNPGQEAWLRGALYRWSCQWRCHHGQWNVGWHLQLLWPMPSDHTLSLWVSFQTWKKLGKINLTALGCDRRTSSGKIQVLWRIWAVHDHKLKLLFQAVNEHVCIWVHETCCTWILRVLHSHRSSSNSITCDLLDAKLY